jgi:hypothetical protein
MRRFFASTIKASIPVPTVQATNVLYTGVSGTTQDISWTRGNGASVIVVMRANYIVSAQPTGAYTANAAFGSGDEIGTGNFVVYSGTGTSVSITGLTAGVLYFVRVYEQSSGVYNTTTAAGNGQSEWTTLARFSSGTIGTNFATLSLAEQRALNWLWCMSSIEIITGSGNNAAKLFSFQSYAGFSTSTKSLLDWVTGGTPTIVNSPTWSQTVGFTGNGTSSYVNTGINPSTVNGGSPVALNDVAYNMFVTVQATSARMGVIGTTSTGQADMNITSAGVFGFKSHTNTTTTYTNATYLGKHMQTYSLRRAASNIERGNFNGQQITTSSQASIGVPLGRTIYVGARNNNGTADQFAGSSMGAMWINVNTNFDYQWWEFCFRSYMMRLGVMTQTQLLPFDKQPIALSNSIVAVRSFAGQSNAAFTERTPGPPLAPLDDPIPNTKTFWRDPFTDPLTIEDLEYGVNNSYDSADGLTTFSSGLRAMYEIQRYKNSLQYCWHYTISGTALSPTNTDGWYPDNSLKLFYDFTTRIGLDGFAAVPETIAEISFHWSQGEADAQIGRTQAEYTADFYYFINKYIDAIESYGVDLTQVKFRIFIARIWALLDTGVYSTRDDIRAAEAAFSVANYEAVYAADAGKISEFIIYDNDEMLHTDGTHMDAEALRIEGFKYGVFMGMS